LYIVGEFPREAFTERKARLEDTIRGLDRERSTVSARLNTGLTMEVEKAIKEIVAKIGKGLNFADADFDSR